jgi:hypothetical protein
VVAGGVDCGFAELCAEASSFKILAFAAATKTTYRCQFHAYLRFCIFYQRVPCPADLNTLKAYIAFLARSLKPSSLPCYLNIVRILHASSGYPNPFLDNWEIAMVKWGVSRALGSPPNQKLPITLSILKLIEKKLDLSLPGMSLFGRRVWCASLACFGKVHCFRVRVSISLIAFLGLMCVCVRVALSYQFVIQRQCNLGNAC